MKRREKRTMIQEDTLIVAIDIGKSFNEQDGNIGFAFGLNYLF